MYLFVNGFGNQTSYYSEHSTTLILSWTWYCVFQKQWQLLWDSQRHHHKILACVVTFSDLIIVLWDSLRLPKQKDQDNLEGREGKTLANLCLLQEINPKQAFGDPERVHHFSSLLLQILLCLHASVLLGAGGTRRRSAKILRKQMLWLGFGVNDEYYKLFPFYTL